MALDTRALRGARWRGWAQRRYEGRAVVDRQTVLIAGGNGNVGGGAAAALARRGAEVVLLGRKASALDARADRIRADLAEQGSVDPAIGTLVLDLSDELAVRRAATEAMDRFEAIDGLILSVVSLGQHGPTMLPNGHELTFATNVLGPFLFTQLLMPRLQDSGALVLHVVAPFYEDIDWDDLESVRRFDGEKPYHRTKTMNRMVAAELARRYAGRISSVAFDPGFIIDKQDPTLKDRWPTGLTGLYWSVMTRLVAKKPEVAGEPIADLYLSTPDRQAINGALFKLGDRVTKPDKAMSDTASCERLWDELIRMTEAAEEVPV
jgi:NAD(P)-dependent dehydrogenase (short-subunit alcohol dehydrogenase family)